MIWHPVYTPVTINVCFTPGQYCVGRITDAIYAAKQSIYVQAYSFTSYKIAKALAVMKRRGIKVSVIMDKSQFQCDHFSQRIYLMKHSVPVWNDYKVDIAHNKVIIIDGKRVETGSYNFTKSAQRYNAENVVIINSAKIARQYLANWQRRKRNSVRVTTLKCMPDTQKT